jgi:sterol carrier protein 2
MPAQNGWNANGKKVFVVGVGMTKFEKPNKRDWDYPDMVKIAVTRALEDAGLDYKAVELATVGYCYGDSTCGQRGLYTVGMTGIPIYNVNNNCSTGSTALFMARQLVQGGMAECALALGFEKMEKGSLGSKYQDRTNPLDQHMTVMMEKFGFAPAPPAAQLFGNAGVEHMQKYGTTDSHFAKIAEKNHRHSANNPYSQFRDVYSLEQILASPKVSAPLTKLQCCPTSDGAGAVLLCSEEFVISHGLQSQAIEIVGQSMKTDFPSSFEEKSMMKCVGYDMNKEAANEVYAQANITPNDVQVLEVHDCFSANELMLYEALGLCPEGGAGAFIDAGDNTYGGKYVVNPSGGLISKGHPLGATGLAQCCEMVWQLRGEADARQVPNVRYALQHNIGLGGAAIVTLYARAKFSGALPPRQGKRVFLEDAKKAPEQAAPTVLAAEAVFAQLAEKVKAEGPALCGKVKAIFRFDIAGPSSDMNKTWLVDLKNAPGSVTVLKEQKGGDCIIAINDANFVKLMTGKLNPQQAFMKGQIKIKGNMMLAQKLSILNAPKSSM